MRRPFVTIDRIESRPHGQKAVVLGDGREITVASEAVEESGLRPGMAAAPRLIESLEARGDDARVHQAALRLLRYRARNERQLRSRLLDKGFAAADVDLEIERLRQVGLVDDRAFAEAFVEERSRISPRSRRLVQMELTAKGVSRDVALESAAAIDDATLATELAGRRLRGMAQPSFDEFVTRVGPYLRRRGFGYEVALNAMRQTWNEARDGSQSPGIL